MTNKAQRTARRMAEALPSPPSAPPRPDAGIPRQPSNRRVIDQAVAWGATQKRRGDTIVLTFPSGDRITVQPPGNHHGNPPGVVTQVAVEAAGSVERFWTATPTIPTPTKTPPVKTQEAPVASPRKSTPPARPAARQAPTPAAGGVTTEVVKITPAIAADWLGRNTHNRTLRNKDVARYAEAIKRDEWVLNGDAIRFDLNGTMQDGQHRLWAVVEADMPIESVVIRGLPVEAQESMDLGARRNLKDVLTLRGEMSASNLAAAVSYHWRWRTDQIRLASARPTIPQALAHLDAHTGLREGVRSVKRVSRRLPLAGGMFAAWIYEARDVDYDDAEHFIDALETGANLGEGSPILVLRHYLERQATLATGARANAVMTHALLTKAWNAYREGIEVEHLTWKASGARPEPFPEMR